MKAFAAILLFALFLGLSSQVDVVTYVVDDFSVDSPAIVVVTPSGGVTSTIITSNFVSDSNILGEERDIEVDVLSGTGNVVVSAGVSGGSFQSAAPQQATAVSYLIYDGPDGNIDLDPSGLFPYDADFTASNSYAMQANITSDTATNVYFRGYSGSSSSYCEFTLNIPGDQVSRLYVMQYTQFTTVGSGCNFANLGALEVEVKLAQNVDIVIEIIELIALAPSSTPTPSPSPSRAAASASNTPSISRTPTPSKVAASASNTPTNSRSPSPSPSSSGCLCTCPEFECYMFNMGTYSFIGTTN